jgi:hypothetical protein
MTASDSDTTDETAWEVYRTAAPTREDIDGSALRQAWFAGLSYGRNSTIPNSTTTKKAPEVVLSPDWLKRDIERALARLKEWGVK